MKGFWHKLEGKELAMERMTWDRPTQILTEETVNKSNRFGREHVFYGY